MSRLDRVHLLSALVAVLVAAPAAAESYWPDLPESRETVIDEPVFGGEAWVFEAGRGHDRTVVLVHVLGEDAAQSWGQVVPDLARDYHVVVFDLPGFGRSTRENELYNPERYAAFVDHVVSRFVDGRFALVGHSMGGAISLRYAATHPDKVERLVLVDAAGILHRAAYSKALAQLGIDHLPGTYPGQKTVSRWIGALFSRTAGVSDVTETAEGMILATASARQRFLQGDPNKIAGYALLLEDFSPLIPRVSSPTLVIWGEKDLIAPLRTGKVLAGNIAGARLEVIPGGRHTPMKSEPKRFRRILADYLAIPPDDLTDGNAHGSPYALDPTVSWKSDRIGRCEKRRRRQVFDGEYDRIIIDRCKSVVLSGVRAREVRVVDSGVEIENSVIRSEGTALRVRGSRVSVTAARLEGSAAVIAGDSRLDIAGAVLDGERVAIEVPGDFTSEDDDSEDEDKVKVLFSVSRVESPETSGYMHGSRTVGPGRPL
jgi:pimeloyl-ACP methyl ester carboxylesterase